MSDKDELDLAFKMLEVHGVPKARARYVANGIGVLVTRMQRENDALAVRLAEAERRITEALAYDDNMDKTTRSILDGSEQFEQRPAASASGMEDVGQ